MSNLSAEFAESGSRLTPAEYRDLASASALTSQLFKLDAVWTNEAQSASTSSGAERSRRVADLTPVVDEIDTLFARLADVLPSLEQIFNAHQDTLRTAFDGLVESGRRGSRVLSEEEQSQLRQVAEHVNGDFAGTVIEQAAQASGLIESERGTMRSELSRLSASEDSDGDFSPETEQALLWVGAGASVFFGPEALAVVEGAAHLVELGVGLFHAIFG